MLGSSGSGASSLIFFTDGSEPSVNINYKPKLKKKKNFQFGAIFAIAAIFLSLFYFLDAISENQHLIIDIACVSVYCISKKKTLEKHFFEFLASVSYRYKKRTTRKNN